MPFWSWQERIVKPSNCGSGRLPVTGCEENSPILKCAQRGWGIIHWWQWHLFTKNRRLIVTETLSQGDKRDGFHLAEWQMDVEKSVKPTGTKLDSHLWESCNALLQWAVSSGITEGNQVNISYPVVIHQRCQDMKRQKQRNIAVFHASFCAFWTSCSQILWKQADCFAPVFNGFCEHLPFFPNSSQILAMISLSINFYFFFIALLSWNPVQPEESFHLSDETFRLWERVLKYRCFPETKCRS